MNNLPLSVPLVKQPDYNTCGHCCVSMVAEFFNHPRIPPDDPLFLKLQHQPPRPLLPSIGATCALAEGFGKCIFYGSDSLSTTRYSNVDQEPLHPHDQQLLERLRAHPCVFLMEWVEQPDRFPDPLRLLEAAVNLYHVPAIVAVDYSRIRGDATSSLHNLVVTEIRGESIVVNNPGPTPWAQKNEKIERDTFLTAWANADNDLIITFKDEWDFLHYLLFVLDYAFFFGNMGASIINFTCEFWDSVVKVLSNEVGAHYLIQKRIEAMNYPNGSTASKLKLVVQNMRNRRVQDG